jgi:hypothetical protein
MFEKLGWMVLVKQKDKIDSYLIALTRLYHKIERKMNAVHNEEKRIDLMIMHKNVMTLINCVHQIF